MRVTRLPGDQPLDNAWQAVQSDRSTGARTSQSDGGAVISGARTHPCWAGAGLTQLLLGLAWVGARANPTVFQLRGPGEVRLSAAGCVSNDGTRVEGVGLLPDVEMQWAVEDLRQNRDPDLVAADWLLLAGD